jgi:hypothetical protein
VNKFYGDPNTVNIRDDLSATTTEEAHMIPANKLFLETGGYYFKEKQGFNAG